MSEPKQQDAGLKEALAEPFEAGEVKFKPAAVSGNRALALAYIDARVVMDRLDGVFGVAGWQDSYECLPDGSVACTLRVKVGNEWISKSDVGSESEQTDEGDRKKAAFSDSLKRAAVKFGIGRYLYRLPLSWVDYDPAKKRIVKPPELPDWALPRPTPRRSAAAPAHAPAAQPRSRELPADGAELVARLTAFEERLVAQGVCYAGSLFEHVRAAGVQKGYDPELVRWPVAAIKMAVDEATAFATRCRAGQGPVHA